MTYDLTGAPAAPPLRGKGTLITGVVLLILGLVAVIAGIALLAGTATSLLSQIGTPQTAPGAAPSGSIPGAQPTATRQERIASTPRLPISTSTLKGSIDLKGARIDELDLAQYKETVNPGSPLVELLSPSGSPQPFYAEFGWYVPAGSTVKVPGPETVWTPVSNGPLTATSPVGFSGGSAYIAGAIPDTGRDGVWLATADGYLFFDRATRTLGTKYTYSAPAQLAENLGGDIPHNTLFAANYAPGVQLVDLVGGTSYYFDGTPFSNAFPNMYEPDGGSVDSGYQVGIVTNEDSPDVALINLKTVVKTDAGTGGRSTFVPGTGGSVALSLGTPTISGSAVDSDTHLALFMAGYSSDVAVGRIQDPSAGGTWQGLSDWRFVRGLTGYSYARDPHAVAVVKNLSNLQAYGYLLDGGVHKTFQIDMAAFLTAPAVGGTGTNAKQLSTDPTTTGIVKTISW